MADENPPDDAELLSRPHEVVYHAEPVWAQQVKGRLEKLGFTPFYLERPAGSGMSLASWTFRIRVAVPSEQAEGARAALAAWEREAAERLAPIGRSLRLQLTLVFAVPAAFLLAWRYLLGLHWSRESFWIAVGIAVGLVAWFAVRQREELAREIRPLDEPGELSGSSELGLDPDSGDHDGPRRNP
jgi:hypothetical protein